MEKEDIVRSLLDSKLAKQMHTTLEDLDCLRTNAGVFYVDAKIT